MYLIWRLQNWEIQSVSISIGKHYAFFVVTNLIKIRTKFSKKYFPQGLYLQVRLLETFDLIQRFLADLKGCEFPTDYLWGVGNRKWLQNQMLATSITYKFKILEYELFICVSVPKIKIQRTSQLKNESSSQPRCKPLCVNKISMLQVFFVPRCMSCFVPQKIRAEIYF